VEQEREELLLTGLVVVGSIGTDLRMDYTAVGDTTNVAARVLQAANLGGGPRISTADSPVSVWMFPTNEEMMIASLTLACIRP
jgi:acetate kinase